MEDQKIDKLKAAYFHVQFHSQTLESLNVSTCSTRGNTLSLHSGSRESAPWATSLSPKTHPTWWQNEVHRNLRWTFPAHSASWTNSCSSCSLHGLLKALGAYLLHIRMWGCNYSYHVKEGEQQRSTTAFFFFFPLSLPLCQHGAAGLPGFATERVGIFTLNLLQRLHIPPAFNSNPLGEHRAEICSEHEVIYVRNSKVFSPPRTELSNSQLWN